MGGFRYTLQCEIYLDYGGMKKRARYSRYKLSSHKVCEDQQDEPAVVMDCENSIA